MKPKTKTILFILLSFILGALCGWFGDERVLPKILHSQIKGPGDFQKMLAERLNLTENQKTQLDSVLENRRLVMDIHRKKMLAMRDSTQMEIRKFLNPDQTKLFDAFIDEMNKRDFKRWKHESDKK
jgi:hypothetical protein